LPKIGRDATIIGMRKYLCLLLLLLTACSYTDRTSGDGRAGTQDLRVLSYNIHHGEGMDGKLDLERIAEIIKSVDPDLVALQEVDKGTERTDRVDQPAVLAELTGMHVVFEQNIPYQGGEYGNAVLSRVPVERYTNHMLPQLTPDEQRGMLEVHIKHAGRPIVFYATHFDYHGDDNERLASADMLRDLIQQQKTKTIIVAGDLNTRPDSAVMAKVTAFLVDAHDQANDPGVDPAYTYPADTPDRRIDYVMHPTNAGLSATESRVMDEPVASDHRPLLTVFEMTDE
jgi:endonuclease/exonuclease/phosphatase family metal-dependent hydrolase